MYINRNYYKNMFVTSLIGYLGLIILGAISIVIGIFALLIGDIYGFGLIAFGIGFGIIGKTEEDDVAYYYDKYKEYKNEN